MHITWIHIRNIKEYIDARHQYEFNDVPKELFDKGEWLQDEIDIDQIQVDVKLIEIHNGDPVHIDRRDNFINAINAGSPILPLIILNCERGEWYLIDGYARYRALRYLGVKSVSVLRQEF